jgi:hypothetical protein
VLRGNSTLLLLSAASLLAGCNSRDSLYSQGPWGPSDVRRTYPQYASPWGGRITGERPLIISGARHPSEMIPVAPSVSPLAAPHHNRHASGLPADPQPPSSVAASVQMSVEQPEQALAPAEQQLQGLAQAPPPAESPPGVFAAPRRASSYAGTWKATDDAGKTCLIHLSSVAALDLYKASTSRCSNEALRNVNLWRFDATRVSLLSHGAEIARLEGSEASLTGILSKSGAPVKMLR